MQKVTIRLNPEYKPKPARVGVGTKLKRVIHRVLDAVPMPAKTRTAIKTCGGCTNREQGLNAVQQKFLDRLAARRKTRNITKTGYSYRKL